MLKKRFVIGYTFIYIEKFFNFAFRNKHRIKY